MQGDGLMRISLTFDNGPLAGTFEFDESEIDQCGSVEESMAKSFYYLTRGQVGKSARCSPQSAPDQPSDDGAGSSSAEARSQSMKYQVVDSQQRDSTQYIRVALLKAE